MPLSWSDPDGIAKALLAVYPQEDRLALDSLTLQQRIENLPGFTAAEKPGIDQLNHILWTWMRLADGQSERGAA